MPARPGVLSVPSAMNNAGMSIVQKIAARFARFASLWAAGAPWGLRTVVPAIAARVTFFFDSNGFNKGENGTCLVQSTIQCNSILPMHSPSAWQPILKI